MVKSGEYMYYESAGRQPMRTIYILKSYHLMSNLFNMINIFLSAYALAELIDNAISATRLNKSGERNIQIHLVSMLSDLS